MHSEETVVRRTKSSDDESAVGLVVDALSEAIGVEPTEMTPLEHTLDTDALETLVTGPGVSISFEHAGAAVSLTEDGVVEVSRLDANSASADA